MLHSVYLLMIITPYKAAPIQVGEIQAEDGYRKSPFMYAPFLPTGTSPYNGILTFTIGYYTLDTPKETV